MARITDTPAGALFRQVIRGLCKRGELHRKPLKGDDDPGNTYLDRLIVAGVPLADIEPEIRRAAALRLARAGRPGTDPERDIRIASTVRATTAALRMFGQTLDEAEAVRILAEVLRYSRRTITRALDKSR